MDFVIIIGWPTVVMLLCIGGSTGILFRIAWIELQQGQRNSKWRVALSSTTSRCYADDASECLHELYVQSA